ncbi:hypothetical protein [Frigoribacterium sp. PhB24]|uniref:hypothetical protein n=1 Tax=Frigoribacterium sp. PhB24 TaxID=2485204 RepID=UPI0011CE1005|nr:hypothetical protein [Frigoribacterium sp. PhB24]
MKLVVNVGCRMKHGLSGPAAITAAGILFFITGAVVASLYFDSLGLTSVAGVTSGFAGAALGSWIKNEILRRREGSGCVTYSELHYAIILDRGLAGYDKDACVKTLAFERVRLISSAFLSSVIMVGLAVGSFMLGLDAGASMLSYVVGGVAFAVIAVWVLVDIRLRLSKLSRLRADVLADFENR